MLLLTKGNSLEEVKWKVYSKGTFSLKLHFSIFSVCLLGANFIKSYCGTVREKEANHQ